MKEEKEALDRIALRLEEIHITIGTGIFVLAMVGVSVVIALGGIIRVLL